MALSEDIRERLLSYLAGQSTFDEFENWLVEESWDAHLTDPEGADLAYDLKLLIVEHTDGDRSEFDLKRAFVPLVQRGPWGRVEAVEPTRDTPPRNRYVLEPVY